MKKYTHSNLIRDIQAMSEEEMTKNLAHCECGNHLFEMFLADDCTTVLAIMCPNCDKVYPRQEFVSRGSKETFFADPGPF